jgi:hypothetical protein
MFAQLASLTSQKSFDEFLHVIFDQFSFLTCFIIFGEMTAGVAFQ